MLAITSYNVCIRHSLRKHNGISLSQWEGGSWGVRGVGGGGGNEVN